MKSSLNDDWEYAKGLGFSKEKHFWGFKTYEAWKYNAGGFNQSVLMLVIGVDYYVASWNVLGLRSANALIKTELFLLLGLSLYEQGLSIDGKKKKAEKAF